MVVVQNEDAKEREREGGMVEEKSVLFTIWLVANAFGVLAIHLRVLAKSFILRLLLSYSLLPIASLYMACLAGPHSIADGVQAICVQASWSQSLYFLPAHKTRFAFWISNALSCGSSMLNRCTFRLVWWWWWWWTVTQTTKNISKIQKINAGKRSLHRVKMYVHLTIDSQSAITLSITRLLFILSAWQISEYTGRLICTSKIQLLSFS